MTILYQYSKCHKFHNKQETAHENGIVALK
jgi:hypothetical protein